MIRWHRRWGDSIGAASLSVQVKTGWGFRRLAHGSKGKRQCYWNNKLLRRPSMMLHVECLSRRRPGDRGPCKSTNACGVTWGLDRLGTKMPPPWSPHTLIVLFVCFELFAEEQGRRKVSLVETWLQDHQRAIEYAINQDREHSNGRNLVHLTRSPHFWPSKRIVSRTAFIRFHRAR